MALEYKCWLDEYTKTPNGTIRFHISNMDIRPMRFMTYYLTIPYENPNLTYIWYERNGADDIFFCREKDLFYKALDMFNDLPSLFAYLNSLLPRKPIISRTDIVFEQLDLFRELG